MGPTWDPSGADRIQMGPTLASWTLLLGMIYRMHHPTPDSLTSVEDGDASHGREISTRDKVNRMFVDDVIKTVHYSDVMSVMASQITGVSIACSSVCTGVDQGNIKAPRHWPLWGESTGDRWFPSQKGTCVLSPTVLVMGNPARTNLGAENSIRC